MLSCCCLSLFVLGLSLRGIFSDFLFVFCGVADFGVSAKNKKLSQRRDTFIGTPYW